MGGRGAGDGNRRGRERVAARREPRHSDVVRAAPLAGDRITNTSAAEFGPAISPDGKWVRTSDG